MTSPASPADAQWPRHTLVTVARKPWRRLVASRDDLAGEPLLAGWADRGWPLIARRPCAGESDGLALGLPLPPSLGKRRVAVTIRPEDVVETRPPPLLDAAVSVAPEPWIEALELVKSLAISPTGPARVFGSLAWQWITGLAYLTSTSDLDLLLPLAATADIPAQTAGLAAIDAMAPMRIDGELLRPDGAAVNWRELHAGATEVMVKRIGGVAMVSRAQFLDGPP